MYPRVLRQLGAQASIFAILSLTACSFKSPADSSEPSLPPSPTESSSILLEPLSPPDSPSPTPSPVRTATPDPTDLIAGYQDFCLGKHMGIAAYIKKSERDNPSDQHHVWFELRRVDHSDKEFQNVDGGIQIRSATFPHWMEIPPGAGPSDERIRIQTAVDFRSPSNFFDRSAGRSITPQYLTVEGRMQKRPDFEKLVNTYSLYWRNWLDNKC